VTDRVAKKDAKITIMLNVVRGALIGIANTIPGVSGGTIAVVTGIYEDALSSLSGFFRNNGGWKANSRFLAPIVLGLAFGIFGFAHVIGYLLEVVPVPTSFFFLGLIVGSLPFLIKTARKDPFRRVYLVPLLLTLGFMVYMSLAERPPESDPIRTLGLMSGVLVFLSGVISSGAMIIPGISGSFILLLIGMYTTFITGLREGNAVVIGVFLVGSVAGLVFIAKLISFFLRRFHGATYYAILGLVAGSIPGFWPGMPRGMAAVGSLFALALGFALAYSLGAERKTKHLTPAAAPELMTHSDPKHPVTGPDGSDGNSYR